MAVVILILSVVIGTIIYKVVSAGTIATQQHFVRKWFWCVAITFIVLGMITGAI